MDPPCNAHLTYCNDNITIPITLRGAVNPYRAAQHPSWLPLLFGFTRGGVRQRNGLVMAEQHTNSIRQRHADHTRSS